MKKKVLALVMTLAMLASLLTVPAAAATGKTFPDAKGHWAEESILRWSRSGLVKGDERGNVNPDKALRRCEMATILSDMLGLRTAAPISTFKDIDGSEWYARAILRCAAAGIMEGSNSMSYPEDHITREEAITMFCRALGVQPSQAPDLSDFTDGDRVSGWAAPYMSTLTELGILSGMGDGSVAPHADINRAGAFTLMDKAISVYANAPGVYTAQNSKGFVVVNANSTQSGDVTITGKANGVMVTVGETNTVRFRDLTAENIVVNGKGDVTVTGKSAVDALVVNTAVAVNVDKDASVDTLDVNVEKVAVTNAGTVKTLNCTKAGSVANSGKVTELVADAAVSVTNTGTVDKLVANAAITVNNTKGTVKDAEINMGGVVMDGPPQQMTVATGVARPSSSSGRPVTATGAAPSSGGGGGGGSSSGSSTTVAVESVSLKPHSWALKVGENVELKATVEPKNATNQTLTWKSGDTTVAEVDKDGKVTAVGAGRATITVSSNSNNNITDTCKIVVYPADTEIIPLDSVKFDAGEEGIIVENGEKAGLYLIITPLNADVVSIDYESSDTDIVTVTKDGDVDNLPEVTAVSPGEATITAKVTVPVVGNTAGSQTPATTPATTPNPPETTTIKATCKVTVKAKPATTVPVESVSISGKPESVKVGDKFTLEAKVSPEEATDKTVTWSSNNMDAATVDMNSGEVTAVGEGEVTITATSKANTSIKDTFTFNVTKDQGGEKDPVVRLSQTSLTLTLKDGETVTETLKVIVDNEETTEGVTWSSGDDAVATVENGLVTAVREGTTSITAKVTIDGKEYPLTCAVEVKPAQGNEEEHTVTLSQTSLTLTLKDGETVTETLKVTVDDEETTEGVTWSSGDDAVATVENGLVTAVEKGTTSITAKVTIDGKEYPLTCAVEVKEKIEENPSQPTITAVTLDKTGTIQLTVDSNGDGETVTIKATITMSDGSATTDTVTWSVTGDKGAVEYNENENEITVTAKSAGTVAITATAGTESTSCTVTVEEASAPPANPTIDKVDFNTFEQSTIAKNVPFDLVQYLNVVVAPEGTEYTTAWEVVLNEGEEAVATVDNGQVTFTAAGKVTVKVTVTITAEGGEPITEIQTITLELEESSDEDDQTPGTSTTPTTPEEPGTGSGEGEDNENQPSTGDGE